MSAVDHLSPRQFGFAGVETSNLPFSYKNLQKKRVRLDRPIFATQEGMRPEMVSMYQHLHGRPEKPMALRHQGKTYIWNGHHRVAGAIRRGQKSMTMMVSHG